ncbi:SPOR domain-containing protein [Arcobacter sp. FWKO B]|uniref:SPOR domain-containing protein n=1 Tax=Arcobacter sp. FWKO B TaxID=2593672 RepID=UPI0018A4C6AA|nr:SPOR domain-containing protein [Arcobacter sp. FWKO B]QOG11688.1 hypothetical protein FWKOB_02780 [Arcobacter sp. FWKO B]
MEFKSEDFLKKVEQASQNKNIKNDDLDQSDIFSINSKRGNTNPYESSGDPSNSELEDILLSSNSSSKDKKKYLVLGASLVVLFLIILILIKVFSGSSGDENLSASKPESIKQEQALEGQSIEQEYQRIINERLKKLQEQKEQEIQQPQAQEVAPTPLVSESIEEEVVQPVQNVVATQPVAVQQTTPVKSEPVVKQTTTVVKQEPVKTVQQPKQTTSVSPSTNLKGFYVQVGAFTREPNQPFITKIQQLGYKYSIFQDTVNGVTYNKVLVGPYSTRNDASAHIENIKKDLNLNSAFILGF